MRKILPVGTVAVSGGRTVLLAGFQEIEENGRYHGYYYCVPYPQGYQGRKYLYLLSWDKIDKVLFPGYCGEEETRYLEGVAEYMEVIRGLPPEKVQLVRRMIKDVAYIRKERRRKKS